MLTQLRLKVAKFSQKRITPFKNGILQLGWFMWFKRHNPDLSIHVSHGLEVKCTKGLCPLNVETFYTNLAYTYNLHRYHPSQIWNCDESGVYVGRNRRALILTKIGSRFVHSITLNECEWLLVLSCINAANNTCQNFTLSKVNNSIEIMLNDVNLGLPWLCSQKPG
jgi:hypothetical protein